MDSFYFPKVTGAQLNSAEHEILNAIEYKNIKKFSFFSGSDKHRMLFFLLINVKMPTRYKIQESLLRIFGPHGSTYRHGISVTNIR